jgi:hypothetical protein
MDFIKIILAALGLLFAVLVIFWLIGFISTILWYLFWIGVIGAIGYAGYKLFLGKDEETPQLQDKMPIGIAEITNVDRQLEEYRSKHLPK